MLAKTKHSLHTFCDFNYFTDYLLTGSHIICNRTLDEMDILIKLFLYTLTFGIEFLSVKTDVTLNRHSIDLFCCYPSTINQCKNILLAKPSEIYNGFIIIGV